MEWGTPVYWGVGFFCFHALEDTKQKKPTPLDRGPPLHVNRVLKTDSFMSLILALRYKKNGKYMGTSRLM